MSLGPPVPAFLSIALLLLIGCGVPAPPAPPAPRETPSAGEASKAPPAVEHLLRLMRDRLTVMHDVARSKWNAHRPVGDPERERVLVREMEEEGRQHGLDPEFTRAFFAAQIAAARRVQEADVARWRAEGRGPFADAPDLAALRKRIDDLNGKLLGTLATARPQLSQAGAREQLRAWAGRILTGEGITDDVRAAAIAPLVER